MRLKRRKRNETALWILGVGAGVAVAAGIFAAYQINKQGRLVLRRDMRALEKRVIRGLRGHNTTRDQAIDVEAVGAGVIELSGYVDTEELAREVIDLVDRIPGVHAVFNRMDIRSVEARLEQNRARTSAREGTRWYGGSVGIGRRRQSPATDPARRDDHTDLKLKALQPNRDDVLSEVEEMEGNGVEIGISRAGPFTTDVPPAKPLN
jgi:hypothetical protein